MGLFELLAGHSNRKPMSVPGDKFESRVAENGDLITKYSPADSSDTYTQVRRKKRITEYHSYDIEDQN